MNDLDERLTRAGEQFRSAAERAPSLDAMLDGATRPRHWTRVILPVAASVVAVAGVAIAVPLARSSGHGHRAAPTAAARPSGPPGSHYLGDETWSEPVLDATHPNIVYVNAEQTGAQGSWGSACTTTPVARIISQTPDAVTIAVGKYAKPLPPPPPGSENACSDMDLGPKQLTIVLGQPLGRRVMIDATDGATRPVLDPASVLKPGYLPAGYTQRGISWGDKGSAVRSYQGPGSSLSVTVGPASLNRSMGHIIKRTTVRGHPATVSSDSIPGFEQDILIAWSEDATHAATLYQMSDYSTTHPALSVAELIRVAQSLR
jgi:hypothetical protein